MLRLSLAFVGVSALEKPHLAAGGEHQAAHQRHLEAEAEGSQPGVMAGLGIGVAFLKMILTVFICIYIHLYTWILHDVTEFKHAPELLVIITITCAYSSYSIAAYCTKRCRKIELPGSWTCPKIPGQSLKENQDLAVLGETSGKVLLPTGEIPENATLLSLGTLT